MHHDFDELGAVQDIGSGSDLSIALALLNPCDTDVYMEPGKRPLSSSERRLLAAKARELRSHKPAARKIVLLAVGMFSTLWLMTIITSDAAWPIVTLFWVVVGFGISAWVWRDAKRDSKHAVAMAQRLESALARNEADIFDLQARSFVEFEELEDEGACYAFDLGRGRIAFVVGQEFYPGARFPSLDFSLVYPLDSEGREVDMLIEKRGPKADPVREIPGHIKDEYVMPEHLQILEGELSELETLLERYPER